MINPDLIPLTIAKNVKPYSDPSIIAGVLDDDCAIINFGGKYLVITSDIGNYSPIMFELHIGDYYDLGRLVVAANISDLLGSGADPKYFLSNIIIPNDFEDKNLNNLLQGVDKELNNYNMSLIGGDTKIGKSFSFSGTAIGEADNQSNLFPKNGAKPGDLIFLSGDIGNVAGAILALENKIGKLEEWAIDKIINPVLPVTISKKLSKTGIINSGADISDGLLIDLHRLCKASQVGMEICLDLLPSSNQLKIISKKLGLKNWQISLTIGGDFQFVVTAPECFKTDLLNEGCVYIGKILDNPNYYFIDSLNNRRKMKVTGHSDFNRKSFVDEVQSLINDKHY